MQLGAYPLDPAGAWNPSWEPEDIADLAHGLPTNHNIWTDGSRDEDLDALIGVAWAGAFVRAVPWFFDGRAWGHAQDLDLEDVDWLQTVQCAEYWGREGGILALQALMPIHLGLTIRMSATM